MAELTEKNKAALIETFAIDVFHPADAYNHLMKLDNWIAKDICGRFEGIKYKNKRSFAKELVALAKLYKDSLNN